MRRYLLLLAICGACSAQSVEGIVEDSLTGQPIAGAHIAFGGATINDRYMSFSDRAGHFERVLPEAAYQVLVSRAGYLPPKSLFVTPGQNSVNLRFQLTPQAVISGKLEDEDGFPVEGARVEAVPYDMVNGQPKLRKFAATDMSNDLGEFRLAILSAGSYYIYVTPSGYRKWDPRYARQYYPGLLDPLVGNAIQVAAGQEHSGLSFTLKKFEGVTVTGHVVVPPGLTNDTLPNMLRLEAADGSYYSAGSTRWRQDDPTFTFRHVQPGTYTLSGSSASTAQQPSGAGIVHEEVEVTGTDVTGVVATVRAADAPGK